jgi:hypothetical protein
MKQRKELIARVNELMLEQGQLLTDELKRDRRIDHVILKATHLIKKSRQTLIDGTPADIRAALIRQSLVLGAMIEALD